MHEVFISHSSKDNKVAQAICHALEQIRIRCWIAPRDVMPSELWAEAINRGIKGSRAFLLIFSDSSTNSRQVLKELTLAVNNGLVIFPLKITNTEPEGAFEYYLSDTHWLDATTQSMDDSIRLMTNTIHQFLHHEEDTDYDFKEQNKLTETQQKKTVEKQQETEALAKAKLKLHIIKLNDKYGFVDFLGRVAIPCQWKEAESFSEGFACVKDDRGKWGFIDKTGHNIIPCQWELAKSFSEGFACVEDPSNNYGFINKKGAIVIPNQWYFADNFSEGLAVVGDVYGRHGYINELGKLVIPLEYHIAGSFVNGLSVVQDQEAYWTHIDKNGLTGHGYYEFFNYYECPVGDFHENLAIFHDISKYEKEDPLDSLEDDPSDWFYDTLVGFINKKGEIVIPAIWENAKDFHEGLAAVSSNGKYGFIDKTGLIVIPCQWEDVGSFHEGSAWVKTNETWRLIDKTGSYIE